MKIWPLLLTSIFPLQAIATTNDLSEDSAYEESEEYDEEEFEDEDDEEEFEGFYGDEDFISLSTGSKKSLAKAPSVASVITAKQIQQMGVRTLSEVLTRVPGLHVAHSSEIYSPKFIVRGITSNLNPQTLVLVDGSPISSLFRGDRGVVWAGFPVHNIARIEIIRGPGSALHGADAFAGVINIITKGVGDINDTQLGAQFGSFDTVDVWTQTAFELGDLKMSFSAEYNTTNGQNEIIEWDAQTNFDVAGLSPAVSRAPGGVNVGYRGYDVRLDLVYHDFNLKIGFQDLDNVGTGQGAAGALDPDGKLGSEKLLIKAKYQREISEDWNVDLRLSHYRANQRVEKDIYIFPEGAFFGALPDGLIGRPEFFETNDIVQSLFTYSGLEKHQLTIGVGYREQDIYRVKDSNNFSGVMVDVSDTDAIFIPEDGRDNYFAIIQDEYQMAPDWELTAGLRYDKYSDFGSTVNPRLAVVWATNRNLSTKFLYGRAFRAPAFLEQKVKNNPISLGNPDVKPETIDTLETAFNYQASEQLHIDLNVYYFNIDKLIGFLPDEVDNDAAVTQTAQNGGKVKGYGLEAEFSYKASDEFSFLINYAYQKTKDKSTDDKLNGAPKQTLFGQVVWQFSESANLSTQVSYVDKVERNQFDTRPSVDSYVNVSFSLNIDNIFEGFGLQLKASNLFDDDIRDPSDWPTAISPGVNIPNDLPQAGRAVYLSFNKTF
ncbi:MAG: TonB-dependent receptor [Algicola sp.]|nr:TonB-dependent receptor [Algicola sp.]